MNEDYSKSLGKTLVESDLTNLTSDILESILDEKIFEDGILKDIPIISSIIGVGKTINTVQNYLFSKKILAFLSGLSEISKEKRNKAISKINSNSKYGQSVGSKLLYLINSSQDHITSKLISKLFVVFIQEELTYQDFCKASLIINKIDIYDLEAFLNLPDTAYGYNGTERLGLEEVDNFLINAGLCSVESSPVTVEDQDDWKSSEKYKVKGGETIIYRTLIGTKIFNVLSKD
ncbi:MAG: hypothetical protein CVU07_02005 [Bacteroidetes bacterium HGW-Bacteroidetes-23]|nr:MAG: hypothetical protein CVU07_02005 [Bacteroidetes bacterium HGW-Bacteroidetes-23]